MARSKSVSIQAMGPNKECDDNAWMARNAISPRGLLHLTVCSSLVPTVFDGLVPTVFDGLVPTVCNGLVPMVCDSLVLAVDNGLVPTGCPARAGGVRSGRADSDVLSVVRALQYSQMWHGMPELGGSAQWSTVSG